MKSSLDKNNVDCLNESTSSAEEEKGQDLVLKDLLNIKKVQTFNSNEIKSLTIETTTENIAAIFAKSPFDRTE